MRRDRATLGLMLGVPIMQLMLFGYAIRQDVRDLPTVVYDMNRTQQSRLLARQFEATGSFLLRHEVSSYHQAIEEVNRGHAKAAVVIPPDYAQSLKRGRPVEVQVLVDATDPTASQSAIGAAQQVGQRVNLQLTATRIRGAFNTSRLQTSFFFLLPNVLLSGFMFPREGMPVIARDIGLALPLTYYLQAIRGIVLKGVGFAEPWVQVAALAGFALLFFSFATMRFQKQLE